jgi:hypothetical protein
MLVSFCDCTERADRGTIELIIIYMHTTHALSPKGQQRHLRHPSETPKFYQNYLTISYTADVTGGKPIAF